MDCASILKIMMNNYSDFGCGFLIFGCFSRVLNVFALLCLFVLGFMFLQFRGKPKLACANDDDDDRGEFRVVKSPSFECGPRKFKGNEDIDEFVSEDEVFDVMTLRKMVKMERRKASAAQVELEKERMAASSSVDEAMAMILRLQNEKSALQIRANQLERAAQENQSHDQDVIQSLQWIIMKHESERSLLEEQLRLCKEKLRVYVKGDEWDEFELACHLSFKTLENDMMIGGLDLDSSPM